MTLTDDERRIAREVIRDTLREYLASDRGRALILRALEGPIAPPAGSTFQALRRDGGGRRSA